MSKKNRTDKEEFVCEKCGFRFNACLNIFSRFYGSGITSRGRRIVLIPSKAVHVHFKCFRSCSNIARGRPLTIQTLLFEVLSYPKLQSSLFRRVERESRRVKSKEFLRVRLPIKSLSTQGPQAGIRKKTLRGGSNTSRATVQRNVTRSRKSSRT